MMLQAQVLICKAAQLPDQPKRFIDPRSKQSFEFDHVQLVSRLVRLFFGTFIVSCPTARLRPATSACTRRAGVDKVALTSSSAKDS